MRRERLNSGKVELIDNAKMVNQLVSLERRTTRGGRDSVDHAPGAHDDIANAVAGAAVLANRTSTYAVDMAWVDGGPDGQEAAMDAWRRMELRRTCLRDEQEYERCRSECTF